ncbi:hypothetical protein CC2G_010100 [Coprinopsis cinerea AmutBmut pab1-1]|nr:hypothetical protein CC2G_010100 [Coprinopsis cinerea AmutBmut pab1-1]
MIPLIPALVLAFVSFLASAFVVLRIIIPILPPSPLSRRVSPAEFGLPTFRSLSPADKGHLWLAGFDLFAVFIFVWHVTAEATSGPSGAAIAQDPLATVRLWFIMTARQGCLLIIAALTLLHVRMGRSFSFGKKHWMLWAPVVLLAVTSTALAGVLSGAGVNGLFPGLTAYTGTFAVLTTISFACLFITLFTIKKNLAALNEDQDTWPPVTEGKSRPSFATEDIDAMRDGASWITSTAGSRRNSMSAWSFSTHHTAVASTHGGRPSSRNQGSVPAKSSFWFSSVNNDDFIPPVPPLPSQFGPPSPSAASLHDSDPFRRELPPLPDYPRGRLGSQNSWLTSTDGTRTTLPTWDFTPTHSVYEASIHASSQQDLQTAVSRPHTPALATAKVLGGYGYAPDTSTEKGLASLAAPAGTEIHLTLRPVIGWFISVWVPFALALPYFIILSQQATVSQPVYMFYVLSVTLSAPLLALNLVFGSGLPIPVGLFDIRESSAPSKRVSTAPSELPQYKWSHEYKRSMSTTPTVVEGRRSGDVWISKGDAVEGKTKFGRAMTMLTPTPKLSVLPPEEDDDSDYPSKRTPPVPFHEGDSSMPVCIHNRSQSETSAQFGRLRTDSSKNASTFGSNEESEFASRIMVAQRHFSTLAQTVVLPAGTTENPTDGDAADPAIGNATGVVVKKHNGASHLRTRSTSSISGPQTPTGSSFNDISPPPPFPLPPTPPNVRAARLAQLSHKKSFSSSYSFKGVSDDLNEIDALTAGVLPLLVPGLKVGSEMKIKDDVSPPGTWSKHKGRKMMKELKEFGHDFSSPEVHSTPARRKPRTRKETHKKNHFSLPSLSLGKEGLHSLANWSNEIRGALESRVGQYVAVPSNVELGYRNTVFGGDSIPNAIPHLKAVQEDRETSFSNSNGGASLARSQSTRSLGLRADVPHGIETARNSMITIPESNYPPSAASTVTLFDEFEAGLVGNPDSHSTPHNSVANKPKLSKGPVPPVPSSKVSISSASTKVASKTSKRSSIVYIKSDENAAPSSSSSGTYPISSNNVNEQVTSTISSITSWSSRTVRPLVPKAGSFNKRKNNENAKPSGSPRDSGLRQLSLLQECDTNSLGSNSPDSTTSSLKQSSGKKQKRISATSFINDENSWIPDSLKGDGSSLVGPKKNLKPLKLARSETSKQRALLRKTEVLPDVVWLECCHY